MWKRLHNQFHNKNNKHPSASCNYFWNWEICEASEPRLKPFWLMTFHYTGSWSIGILVMLAQKSLHNSVVFHPRHIPHKQPGALISLLTWFHFLQKRMDEWDKLPWVLAILLPSWFGPSSQEGEWLCISGLFWIPKPPVTWDRMILSLMEEILHQLGCKLHCKLITSQLVQYFFHQQ